MPSINLSVKDKRADGTGVIVCGNSDYTVSWELDDEWSPYEDKTMRVTQADGTYMDVLFQGTEATIPVLTVPGWVSIGLYAGNLHTTTPANCIAVEAITTAARAPADPPPDVYNQLMERLAELETIDPAEIEKAVNAYFEEHPVESVLYTEQTLTEDEQTQARANIAAASQKDVEAAASGEKDWRQFTMGNVNGSGFRVNLELPTNTQASSLKLTKSSATTGQASVTLDTDGWLTISGHVLNLGYPTSEAYNTIIRGVATPVSPYDAATKKYVDDTVSAVTALPNPHKLTFSGASSAEYDGSAPVTVSIPDAYSKAEIDAIMGSYIDDIDTLIGGDS